MTRTHIAIDLHDDQKAARVLSLLKREHVPYQVHKKEILSEEEKAEAREIVMRGAPTLNVEEMLAWLEESKKDRPMPFRNDE